MNEAMDAIEGRGRSASTSGQTSGGQTSRDQTTRDQTSHDQTTQGQTSGGQASGGQTSARATSGLPPDVTLVDSPEAWAALESELRSCSQLALDLEADGFHRYPERVALVQLALPSGHLLIVDPVRLTRLDLLGELLGDTHVEVVVHAGAFDLRSMDRDFGFHIRGLFDTAVAAQFCGARRTGLGNVLAEFTGIHLDKPKRYQRLDWSARPLKPGALDYASGDVRYLLALAAELKSRLRELGRLTWVEEECARLETVRYEAPRPPDESWMSIRGARDLSDPSRAVLRELNVFREAEARRSGKPPYRVITNKTMLELAQRRTADVDRLGSANGEGRRRFRERLRQALQRGIDAEPQPWPRRAANGRWSHHARDRLKALKRWRAGEAEVLDLDPGIVWPMDHLKAIAVHEAAASGELDGPESRVRRWQWDNLGPSLERFRREQLGDPV